jgi:hypothetical protein
MMAATSTAMSADAVQWQDFQFYTDRSIRDLVRSRDAFAPLGVEMRAWTKRVKSGPHGQRAEVRASLRITMLHLDLHDGRFTGPLEVVEELRAEIADPLRKALTGLTTEAIVAARREVDPKPAKTYLAVFRRHFSHRIAALPQTESTSGLSALRDKLADTRLDAILEDIDHRLAPKVAKIGYIEYKTADEIIRYRHKIADILPIRDTMIEIIEDTMARPTEQTADR